MRGHVFALVKVKLKPPLPNRIIIILKIKSQCLKLWKQHFIYNLFLEPKYKLCNKIELQLQRNQDCSLDHVILAVLGAVARQWRYQRTCTLLCTTYLLSSSLRKRESLYFAVISLTLMSLSCDYQCNFVLALCITSSQNSQLSWELKIVWWHWTIRMIFFVKRQYSKWMSKQKAALLGIVNILVIAKGHRLVLAEADFSGSKNVQIPIITSTLICLGFFQACEVLKYNLREASIFYCN